MISADRFDYTAVSTPVRYIKRGKPTLHSPCSNAVDYQQRIFITVPNINQMSWRSPIQSGPSSPPASRSSYSRRGSGSQLGSVDEQQDYESPRRSGLSIREKGRLAEEEAAIKRRGQEPSLSYIAVVSGDQQVSATCTSSYQLGARMTHASGHLSIRFRFSDGCSGVRSIRIDRKELLRLVPSGRVVKVGGSALVSQPPPGPPSPL